MCLGADFDAADYYGDVIVVGVGVGVGVGVTVEAGLVEEVEVGVGGVGNLAGFLPRGDVGGGEDLAAGDGVGLRFAGRQEGDVVAEARRVDYHQVGARRHFFDPADAVGGLRVAVEL